MTKVAKKVYFPPVFYLDSLNGTNGFTINGIYHYDYSGIAVSGAGDFNADGIDDIIIGASQANYGTGQSYIVYGIADGFPAVFDLKNLNRTSGLVIDGIDQQGSGRFGSSVSDAGDVNADGIRDIIIAAPYANNNAGQSYVLFGCINRPFDSINLEHLNGMNGFAASGSMSNQMSGTSVSGVGDVNGDGIDDIVILSWSPSNFYVGHSHIVFGNHDRFPASFRLEDLDGSNGFAINNDTPYTYIGSISGAGDINADGIKDIVIGSPSFDTGAGQMYIVYGSQNGFPAAFNLTNLNGQNGFTINGFIQYGYAGCSVDAAGDVNGDGIDDLIIGANGINNYAGQSYVIFGSQEGFSEFFDLTSLNGVNGFTISGFNQESYAGSSVKGVSDINADGIDDIMVMGYKQAYLIFGNQAGFPAVFNISSLDGSNGFTVLGNSSNGNYFSGSGAGDVNADGIKDIILGAFEVDGYTGQSYVILGQDQLVEEPHTGTMIE